MSLAIEQGPDEGYETGDEIDVYYKMGDAYTGQGKHEEAIDAYLKAHYKMGDALIREGKYEEALSAYHKAVELDPEEHSECCYGAAHCNLGDVFNRVKANMKRP